MASKKVYTLEDAIKFFKEVMQRASLSYNNVRHLNGIIITATPKGHHVLIIPDKELWKTISDDNEININETDNSEEIELIRYAEDITDWIPISFDNEMYTGKLFNIDIHGFEYPVSINRDLMPLKLKKAEYEGLSYKIFINSLMIGIMKRFESIKGVDDSGFYMIRLFQIV